jgi:hypothetical protein
MPPQIGQVFFAGLPVNQVDDECPHDRTPLLIGVLDRRCRFQDAFMIPKNGFTGAPKWFRQAGRWHPRTKTGGTSFTNALAATRTATPPF